MAVFKDRCPPFFKTDALIYYYDKTDARQDDRETEHRSFVAETLADLHVILKS
jgi:hypothetical protein